MNIKFKSRLSSYIVISLLAFSFFMFVPFPKGYAVNATFVKLFTTSSTLPSTLQVTGWNPSLLVGDTYILTASCQPSSTHIAYITDTTNSTWIKVGSIQGGTLGGGGVAGVITDMWYTTQVATALNSINIVVNFALSEQLCGVTVYNSNVPLNLIQATSVVGAFRTFATLGNPPRLNTNLYSSTLHLTGIGQDVVFNYIFSNSTSGTNFVTFTPNNLINPLVNIFPDAICSGGWQEPIQCQASQITINLSPTTIGAYTYGMNIQNANAVTNTYSYAMFTVVFNTQVAPPPNCSTCGIGSGGNSGKGITIDKTTSFSTTGNSTFFYLYDSPVGGALIQNISVKVSSYVNAGVGKSTEDIYLCIYMLLPGQLSNKTAITSTNPLNQVYCQLDTTVKTGATDKYVHVYPNRLIPPNTGFAIAIFSRYSGLRIYAAIVTDALKIDTVDYTGTLGVPPIALSTFSPSSPNIYLTWSGSQTQVISNVTVTVTAASSTSTVTTTSVSYQVTTLVYNNLKGGTGSIIITQNLVTYWPIWLIPMLFIPFGIQGILIGFIMSLMLSGMLQIIPLWAAFLMALGIFYLLTKRF